MPTKFILIMKIKLILLRYKFVFFLSIELIFIGSVNIYDSIRNKRLWKKNTFINKIMEQYVVS